MFRPKPVIIRLQFVKYTQGTALVLCKYFMTLNVVSIIKTAAHEVKVLV
jgi:hypothetical protein